MRALLIIIFFVTPSLIFAQSLDTNQRFSSGESPVFHSDPLTNRMLNVDNPCNDEWYLELRSISPEELADTEYAIFRRKAEECGEYYRTFAPPSTDSVDVEVKSGSSSMQPYILAGGGVIALSVVLLIVL